MPKFDAPEPLFVTLEFDQGSARIAASKRTDAVVEVRPANSAEELDVRTAEQTKVTCADGKLVVKGPRKRSVFGRTGVIDVSVELPAGSDLHVTTPMADIACEGRLGDCRIKTSFGDIQVDEVATANLRTGHGAVRADRITGDAEVVASGTVAIETIAGAATVKNSNGETTIGEVVGDLKVNAANGRIDVGTAQGGVDARSANGSIRIGDVARGRVVLQVAAGDIEVGIRESTAAWLDVHTGVGRVRNSLGAAEGPGDSAETVEVRARTSVGDIDIRRP
ncbi:DUF4097 family beta strand repeat-containing protein [Streptomyces sp. NPDC048506]|uniref:DUF4097 family beta strand repeat-containing protein n=1 Tax=Streptomyces sp. NPDC048506 TaxID=3155028 RepID=UPI00343086B7